MSEASWSQNRHSAPVTERFYSGHKGDGVFIREDGQSRPLDPRYDLGNGQAAFAWGIASPGGRQLALALLADALDDSEHAIEYADAFTQRVVSILPDRWTMSRARVLSYVNVLMRDSGTRPAGPHPKRFP